MRFLISLLLLVAVTVMIFGAIGCEDDVKVQRSYEGSAPPPGEKTDEGETVYQRSVRIDSDDDDDDVKIQRSSETSTQTQHEVVAP